MVVHNVNRINQLHEKFVAIVKLADRFEKLPRRFGTEELLTSSEIHLVEVIGDNTESYSVTDLAGILGVTKGAVSQNLKRLEKKGLTMKQTDPKNRSRAIVGLTSKGKAAYYAHQHWHETLDGGFKEYYLQLDKDKIDFLLEFLDRLELFMRRVAATDTG